MEYQDQKSICICSDNMKMASLIYDKILPIPKYNKKLKSKTAMEAFLPKEVLFPMENTGNLRQFQIDSENGKAKINVSYYLDNEKHPFNTEWIMDDMAGLVSQFTYELLEIYFRTQSLERKNLPYSIIPPSGYEAIISNSDSLTDSLGLTFTNLKVIDAENADWKQILEFRKDKDSLKKLRRFKLFFYDHLVDKDISYINDLLAVKMEDYENSCKKHGIDMVQKSFKTILNSKILLAGFSSSMAALILNKPELFQLSAIGTGVLELGRITLEVAHSNVERKIMRNANEISYFIEANKKLKAS
tara:strand:- start:1226 stop:2131 length:906 start_codon:yes stop_codon:yes gene_type:complete